MNAKNRTQDLLLFVFLCILAILFLTPIFLVLMNSFKGRFFISDTPFALPTAQTFAGIKNYISGIAKTGFLSSFRLLTIHNCIFRWYHRAIYIHDSLVYHPGKIKTKHSNLFSDGFFNDRSIPDGDVYHVKNGEHNALG